MTVLSLIISTIFGIACYFLAGYVLVRLFRIKLFNSAVSFFLGAGTISIITLFVSFFFPTYLELTSMIVLGLFLTAGIILFAIRRNKKDTSSQNNQKQKIVIIALLFLMILPILIGSYDVKLWGDELNMEGPMVRSWLQTDNFYVDQEKNFSFYSHPRLWVIMIYQNLILNEEIHEAAGRWLSILIIFLGALFVVNELIKKWKLKKWPSVIYSCFFITLVFGTIFAWSASWYYTIIVSMLVMISFYYLLAAKEQADQKINYQKIAVSAILCALITGIRPDGIAYLPMLLLLLFISPRKNFIRQLKTKLTASLILIAPTLLVYFGWRIYVNSHNLLLLAEDHINSINLNQIFEKFWPVIKEMFQIMFTTELLMTGFLFFCFFICLGLAIYLFKHFKTNEKQFLLLLTVPAYKFLLIIIFNLTVLESVRVGRHLMQTAPLICFILGFLILKLIELKFGNFFAKYSRRAKIATISIILIIIFIIQLAFGSIFSHLPSEMNEYMADWTSTIRAKHPEQQQVQLLIPEQAPDSTRIHIIWLYYSSAQPEIFSNELPTISSAYGEELIDKTELIQEIQNKGVDAVLVYAPDQELADRTNLNLSNDKDYLIRIKDDNFEIIETKERPYENTWGIPWRMTAIKSFIKSLMFWQ